MYEIHRNIQDNLTKLCIISDFEIYSKMLLKPIGFADIGIRIDPAISNLEEKNLSEEDLKKYTIFRNRRN